jgi:hypothetical protein
VPLGLTLGSFELTVALIVAKRFWAAVSPGCMSAVSQMVGNFGLMSSTGWYEYPVHS